MFFHHFSNDLITMLDCIRCLFRCAGWARSFFIASIVLYSFLRDFIIPCNFDFMMDDFRTRDFSLSSVVSGSMLDVSMDMA